MCMDTRRATLILTLVLANQALAGAQVYYLALPGRTILT
jgi:hypothetical protein